MPVVKKSLQGCTLRPLFPWKALQNAELRDMQEFRLIPRNSRLPTLYRLAITRTIFRNDPTGSLSVCIRTRVFLRQILSIVTDSTE